MADEPPKWAISAAEKILSAMDMYQRFATKPLKDHNAEERANMRVAIATLLLAEHDAAEAAK